MAPSIGSDTDLGGFALLQVGIGADKIYGWFKDGIGPERTTDASQRMWEMAGREHMEVAYLINKAVADSGAVWEGAAGDQARSSTSPLASWSEAAGTSARSAAGNTSQISDSFRLARDSVEKPVDVPDKPWYNDALPWDTDYDDAVEKSQQVNARNMQVLSTYGSSANAAGAAMPTFQSPEEIGAGIDDGGGEPPIPRPKEWNGRDEVGDDGRGTDPGGSDGNTRRQWGEPTVPPPTPPGGNDDGTTRKSQVDPPDRPVTPPPNIDPPRTTDPRNPVDPRVPPPFDPRPPYDPRNPNDPRNRRDTQRPPVRLPGPGGGRGGVPTTPGGGPGGPGGGRGGLGGPSGPGSPGGLGGRLPGAGPLGGGGMSGALPERGFGSGGGGFGPNGAGAAGARGGLGAGMGGMGGGAGHGQGEEDKEHKSASYLQETEDIFGDGTMVAPPVIGE
ncbi:hypothetical protein [Saccharothrix obliqua]|uniref:hypothetical protein n=1 Tax=Saccharothrix obliqua TaxID=2861747 RepID=UPI001C5DC81C|nr:hypothetical protein [Saccharothrix obliqua]MBW4720748.1 hypothetical protein [Saccharothrix obliqua]